MTSVRDSEAFSSAQDFEKDWHGNCCQTFGEEAKQITYAHRMGLINTPLYGKWPVYDLSGKSVLDLGGGPVSMLLKTINGGSMLVVDPCCYPQWTRDRYDTAGIHTWELEAEKYTGTKFDECWIYNVLQHVVDPEAVIETARKHAKVLRIFEWIETETNVGHPHTLHAHELNEWIGGSGRVEYVDENGAVGLAFHGVFDLRARGADNGGGALGEERGVPGSVGA